MGFDDSQAVGGASHSVHQSDVVSSVVTNLEGRRDIQMVRMVRRLLRGSNRQRVVGSWGF